MPERKGQMGEAGVCCDAYVDVRLVLVAFDESILMLSMIDDKSAVLRGSLLPCVRGAFGREDV